MRKLRKLAAMVCLAALLAIGMKGPVVHAEEEDLSITVIRIFSLHPESY